MRRLIATVCLSGTLEEKLSAASLAGFDGVELFEPDLISSPLTPREVRRYADDLGLEIDLYQPFRDFEGVSEGALQANLRRAERKFDVMSELGARLMLVCSNVSQEAIDEDDRAARQLHRLADLAARHEIRVAYEALAWGRHVHDYERSWSIVAAADHPQLGVCLDSFHILARDGDPRGFARIPVEKIFFVQLADAPRLRLDLLQWSRHYRCFPGQGAFDVPGFVECLLRTGYDGPLSLEVFNDVFRQSDPRRTATDAMRSLLALEDEARPAPPARLNGLPPSPGFAGYAFAELAVDFRSALAIDRLLAAMGFVHIGDHRSKLVELWQSGGVRIVVNRSTGTNDVAHVAAIALESLDPTGSVIRAEALLAPAVPLPHGPTESDIAAVAAPDGSAIFFCRTAAGDSTSWLGDFSDETRPAGPPGGLQLLCIDHVALSAPLENFDEAALFYRSVLGLHGRDREELTSPDGLVRSRAFADGKSQVRFVLNAPALGIAGSGVRPGPQHVALACADALAAAQTLAEHHVPMLHISDNYYDDLAARVEIEPSLLETMRGLGVLYDRDEHGEFLHFYIDIPGGRMFLELVERRGAYDGYGSVNSPVRMAAQRARSMVGGVA